jgi:hypothetical protein
MKYLQLFLCLMFFSSIAAQGVLISDSPGQVSPDAGLEVNFNDKGLLLPRLTLAQRNAIPAPNAGLVIFNTSSGCAEVYTGSGWSAMACECLAPPPAPVQVSGPQSTPCIGDTGVVFTVSAVAGANSYNWVLPSGMILSSGQGSQTITAQITGTVGSDIEVAAVNGCGSSSPFNYSYPIQAPDASFTTQPSNVATNQAAQFIPAESGTHSWSFASGNPASSSSASPSVTWSSAGTYTVIHTLTSAAGCVSSDTVAVPVSNCVTGGSATFSFTGNIVTWTVPANVCNVTIDVRGAQGGMGNAGAGGLGARMTGEFSVTPGDVYQILVGSQGLNNTSSGGHSGNSTGGGGGSFVALNGQPVIVAGGGGGGGAVSGGLSASITQNGVNGSGSGGASGGTAGNGGSNNGGMNSGRGGGGFSGNGLAPPGDSAVGGPGFSFTNGGAGGSNGAHAGGGGFGGGGGGGNYGGGGGGGYSGGGGGSSNGFGGGGGGSFNSGSNQSNTAAFQSGNGQVIISW